MRMWTVAALLVACAPPLQHAEPSAAAIDGRYVVTTIDGKSPVINIAGHEPTVTIAGQRVHFQSQCIYADWTLEKTASGVRAKPYYEPGSAMCARSLAPGETAVQDTFTHLSSIARASDGALRVEGGDHRLELRPIP